jgi:hypothetical protein
MTEETPFHGVLANPGAEHAACLEQAFAGKPEGNRLRASRRSMWMRVTSSKAERCDRRAGGSLLQFPVVDSQIASCCSEKSSVKHYSWCTNRSSHSLERALPIGRRCHTMKTVIRVSPRDSAKAWALLVRHSPGVALPDRVFVVSEEAARALRNAGIRFSELSREASCRELPILAVADVG